MIMGTFTYSQTNISGNVVDQDNVPIPGANIVIVGTTVDDVGIRAPINGVQLVAAAGGEEPALTWDFNDGLPEGSEVAGNAEHSATEGVDGSGALVITRALGGQLGGWLSAEVGTVSSFIIDFDILMDGGTATQADGISMAISDDLVPFAAFSEGGVGSGLRVNFDNWDNGDGAPSIEIEYGGERIASVPMGTQAESTLDTDGWWPVRIELTSGGDLTLLYNDELIHDGVNIADFAPIENARIAFGGRTGGANANQFIDNFSIVAWEAAPATPALSIVNNGDGTVTVTFEGKLQGALTVNGPWADVEGAVSPQIIPATEAMQYGRAVSE